MEPMQWLLVPMEEYCSQNPQNKKSCNEPYPLTRAAQQIHHESVGRHNNTPAEKPNDTAETHSPTAVNNTTNSPDDTLPIEHLPNDNEDSYHTANGVSNAESEENVPKEKPEEQNATEMPKKPISSMPEKLESASKSMSAQAQERSKNLYNYLIALEGSSYNDDTDTYSFNDFSITGSLPLSRLLNEFCTRRLTTTRRESPAMEKFWDFISKHTDAREYSGGFYRAKYSSGEEITVRKSDRLKSIRLTHPPSFSRFNKFNE